MIPKVGKYAVNFWKAGKCIATVKVHAPTKHLAWLNVVFDHPEYLKFKIEADKITIGRLRKV